LVQVQTLAFSFSFGSAKVLIKKVKLPNATVISSDSIQKWCSVPQCWAIWISLRVTFFVSAAFIFFHHYCSFVTSP